MKPQDNKSSRAGRIPPALQAIFLASNGGAEVDVPPRNMGFKVFSRILGGKNKKQVYNKPSKNVQVSAPTKEEVRQTVCPFSVYQIVVSLETYLSFPQTALNGASKSTGFLRYRSEAPRILHRAVRNHQ
jgi:hypothetical protein